MVRAFWTFADRELIATSKPADTFKIVLVAEDMDEFPSKDIVKDTRPDLWRTQ